MSEWNNHLPYWKDGELNNDTIRRYSVLNGVATSRRRRRFIESGLANLTRTGRASAVFFGTFWTPGYQRVERWTTSWDRSNSLKSKALDRTSEPASGLRFLSSLNRLRTPLCDVRHHITVGIPETFVCIRILTFLIFSKKSRTPCLAYFVHLRKMATGIPDGDSTEIMDDLAPSET